MLKKLAKWIGVLLAAAVAAFAVFLLLVDRPLYELEVARWRQAQLQDDYARAYARVLQIDKRRERMPTLRSMHERVKRLLPDADGLEVKAADLEASVRAAAVRSGVAAYELSLGRSVPREFYADRPFSVRATGQYRQLAEFLRQMSSGSGELRMLRQVSVAPQPGTGELQLDVSAIAFALLSDAAVAELRKVAPPGREAGSR